MLDLAFEEMGAAVQLPRTEAMEQIDNGGSPASSMRWAYLAAAVVAAALVVWAAGVAAHRLWAAVRTMPACDSVHLGATYDHSLCIKEGGGFEWVDLEDPPATSVDPDDAELLESLHMLQQQVNASERRIEEFGRELEQLKQGRASH